MGDVTEKHGFVPCCLLCCFQGSFQKKPLLDLLIFLFFNLAEAEQHFIAARCFVEDQPDIYPFADITESPLIISAKIIYAVFDQLLDVFDAETLFKFFIDFFVHQFTDGADQKAIAAAFSQSFPDIL